MKKADSSRYVMYKRLFLLSILVVFMTACVAKIEKTIPPLVLIDADEYPFFADDLDLISLELAVNRSFEYYNRLPEDRICHVGDDDYTIMELRESLRDFLNIMKTASSGEERNTAIKRMFNVYKSVGDNGRGRVLFTGYYAPVLRGSIEKTPVYRYPIYKTPDNHVVINLDEFNSKYKGERIIARVEDGRVVPYYTREDIDSGQRLKDRNLEIAWLADAVDRFFLHIQGSGIICFSDGECIRVSYAQCNGHPYRSVGRLLIDQGKISVDQMSLESIKNYLTSHPEEMAEILNHNESYVFFRVVDQGPVGSLDVTVTSERTIATDAALFPKGALAFIKTRKPVIDGNGNIVSWSSFGRFVLNQDTGGAIDGPGRVDIFCGEGKYAGTMAGHMKEEGELYFLVKKKE